MLWLAAGSTRPRGNKASFAGRSSARPAAPACVTRSGSEARARRGWLLAAPASLDSTRLARATCESIMRCQSQHAAALLGAAAAPVACQLPPLSRRAPGLGARLATVGVARRRATRARSGPLAPPPTAAWPASSSSSASARSSISEAGPTRSSTQLKVRTSAWARLAVPGKTRFPVSCGSRCEEWAAGALEAVSSLPPSHSPPPSPPSPTPAPRSRSPSLTPVAARVLRLPWPLPGPESRCTAVCTLPAVSCAESTAGPDPLRHRGSATPRSSRAVSSALPDAAMAGCCSSPPEVGLPAASSSLSLMITIPSSGHKLRGACASAAPPPSTLGVFDASPSSGAPRLGPSLRVASRSGPSPPGLDGRPLLVGKPSRCQRVGRSLEVQRHMPCVWDTLGRFGLERLIFHRSGQVCAPELPEHCSPSLPCRLATARALSAQDASMHCETKRRRTQPLKLTASVRGFDSRIESSEA